MPKILFLAANARDETRLRLDVEVRDVKKEIAEAGGREAFPVETALAVMPEQLQGLLQDHRPELLHFSGHGVGRSASDAPPRPGTTRDMLPEDDDAEDEGARGGGIVLEDQRGAAVTIPPEALTRLIEIARRRSALRVVVFNACFSADLARDVARHVECAIGMKRAIDDRAAIAFAVGFYRALAAGDNLQSAFDCGCHQIEVRKLPDKDVPELFHRPEVNPETMFLDKIHIEKPPSRNRLRRAAPFVVALSLLVAAAAAFLPLTWVQVASPQSGAIVVAGPWLGSEPRRTLCVGLDQERKEREPRVQCLARPLLGAGDDALRQEALSAGASLLVLVDEKGSARILPLGELADHEILGRGLPPVDLAITDAARQIPPLLRSLAQIADHAGHVQPDLIRCPSIVEGTPRSVALLSLLTQRYARGCAPLDVSLTQPPDACEGDAPSMAACWLEKYIYAYVFPGPSAGRYLRQIRDDGPEQMKGAAALLAARRACEAEVLEEAMQTATELSESLSACGRLTASLVAACVLSKPGGAGAERAAWLRDTEAFEGNDAAGACPSPLRAMVLGERAWWRTQRALWAEAARDYEAAWSALRDQDYRMNLVEVLLRQGKIKDARQWLDSAEKSRPLTPRDRTHEALLRWIAERLDGKDLAIAVDRVMSTYRELPLEQKVLGDPRDPVLLPLVCPEPAARCPLEVLASPRTSSSDKLLMEALLAAGAR